MKDSKIEWTKSTWNPWIGCTKVSPACDHCYAAEWDRRFHKSAHWGSGAERLRAKASSPAQVFAWNAKAPGTEFAGIKGFWPVFVESMGDFFDNEVPAEWRDEAWSVMRACKNLTFILITKRPGNIPKMLPKDWPHRTVPGGYPNVWFLTSVWDQESADRNIPALWDFACENRGISAEPLLGPIVLGPHLLCREDMNGAKMPLDWVIVGGETGPKARFMHPDWALSLRDQCKAEMIPFFFKQWGTSSRLKSTDTAMIDPSEWREFPPEVPF